ncbi:TorF family putative porin [Shewanella sp. CG12_big_fil_rev_8_21_14_0_65_47_15]|uniref:TorF family putative porin n=1 Tax=Shewanella sp. CG12_big_fil_rev_8_21_14_0_65_47_15 TaxID=1975537 RepID=UPI000CA8E55B|nr:TorF family putative porin [Shewanella sp. CG12_big_fil_rev_8_21_14_0_65_47_15]PIW59482.1 MAG: hypothetical protein COW15_17785 [Shewanella sp. CG12_big_fil_rev_8_21_14_0_65_47_15]
MNNKVLYLAFFSVFAFPTHADVTGFMSAQSNFLSKGETLTDNGPALYGLITYNHESGFYIGADAFNIDFGNTTPGVDDKTSYEIDYFAGYAKSYAGYLVDIGYIYYSYPDAYCIDSEGKKTTYGDNFGEAYLEITKKWLKASLFYGNAAQEVVDFDNDAITVALTGTFPITEGLDFTTQVGHAWFNSNLKDDYLYYNATITKHTDLGDVFFTLSDTDQMNQGLKTIFGFKHFF